METRVVWLMLLVLVAGSTGVAEEYIGLCKYLSGSFGTRLDPLSMRRNREDPG